MKIRPVGIELFHANGRTDGQTDRHDDANGRFSKFCERAVKKKQINKFSLRLYCWRCRIHL